MSSANEAVGHNTATINTVTKIDWLKIGVAQLAQAALLLMVTTCTSLNTKTSREMHAIAYTKCSTHSLTRLTSTPELSATFFTWLNPLICNRTYKMHNII